MTAWSPCSSLILFCLLAAFHAHPQSTITLHTFGLAPDDGFDPSHNGLILSSNTLFGATRDGASTTNIYSGSVFAVNTDGTGYAVLHVFDAATEGAEPSARFVLDGDTLYGTAQAYGPNGLGTLFSIKTNGTGFSVLHAFGGGDGAVPNVLLLSGTTLYGITAQGGANQFGTIYSIGTDGSGFSVLYQFSDATGNPVRTNIDGINPAGLTLAGSTLYGDASLGGANGGGTLFAFTTDTSEFTVLHNFGPVATTNDANEPSGELVVSGDRIYGTTMHGGAGRRGAIYSVRTNGSDFTLVHSFNRTDGDEPYAGVILSGNTLYGTTISGGSGGQGAVFAVNTGGGSFNVLYNFSSYTAGNNTNSDGALPEAGLLLWGNTLYGVAAAGGAGAAGTAFGLQILPSISNITTTGGTLMLNAINAVAGSEYVVLKSNDPVKPVAQWTALMTNTPATTGNFTITIPNAVDPQEPFAFYRLRAQPAAH